MTAAISIADLAVYRGGQQIVRDVSATIMPASCFWQPYSLPLRWRPGARFHSRSTCQY